jgi:hypothetical protein
VTATDWAVATDRIRFYARWAIGWAVVVAVHPPALVEMVVVGGALAVARRDDGHNDTRISAFVAGISGALILLLPWSIEFLTGRTPLFGRPGWLGVSGSAGIAAATLGAGYALVGWLVVAYGGAVFVGLTRTTLALAVVGAAALLAGAGGVLPAATMLLAVGACALTMIALAVRAIADELPRYELGLRHGLVVAGAGALVAMWFISAVFFVATGVRARSLPVIATGVTRSGRVLWVTSTTGGVRTWTTLGFDSLLRSFPPSAGPAERLAAGAVIAARKGRTHRAGSILALADVSHVVVLDTDAGRGLEGQADLALSETHDNVVVYRNESWAGPAFQLEAPPSRPFTASGLSAAARDAVAVPVAGWPRGRIEVGPAPSDRGVVYVAGGARRGWAIGGAHARIVAAGEYVPGSALTSPARARPPGAWHFLVPLEVVLSLLALGAWGTAAYLSRPTPAAHTARRIERPIVISPPAAAVPAAVVLLAFVLGYSGLPARAAGGFLSSAWYCPPIGGGFVQSLAIANPATAQAEVVVRPALGAPPIAHQIVPGRTRMDVPIDAAQGAVVESYGQRVAVATQVSRGGNYDSSLCAPDAQTLNLFPEGGRAATLAVPRLFERYIIYNPFADVARASVRFLSANEMIAPPPLQDVQVKPGGFVVVNPEEQFEPMRDLSTVINVWQGRAIVARRLTTVDQVSWSLGSPLTTGGVLPRALTQTGQTKVIALNPTDTPVRLSVDGFADQSTIPLQTFDVEPNSRSSFVVNTFAPQARGLEVNIRADNPVALESLVVPVGRTGLSLLPPSDPGRDWVVAMAEGRQVVVVNPQSKPAKIDFFEIGGARVHATVTVPADSTLVSPAGAKAPSVGWLVRSSRPVTVAAFGPGGPVDGVPGAG